ncbi:hypothetical protein [Microbacterium sp. W4I20]|uniref:hypothetical protein n=1 Tax=Microbacterium sp. W4I20 TaxID=3042262 RepID=UPI00277F947D|nr:hypothetical protein [Microbacterium sp. W4I20]MDQ0727048.1 NAD(P)-dependent dehydrogenase (short-subunit alcohol dehydrogenase family) [Microbacterium sp. W4I20]
MDSVLVVGASGILAPAASALVRRGVEVTGIGRRHPMPAGVVGMHVDARDLLALDAALGTTRWRIALVYEPAITPSTFRRIEAAIDGRTVLVRTSAAADPARGEPSPAPDTLLLGWHDDGENVRWHTPTEVSDAALQVLDDGQGRVLGVVRPWERRP